MIMPFHTVMKPTELLDATADTPEVTDHFGIAVIYEDALTQQWAQAKCRRTRQLVGADYVRSTWWELDFLSQPRVNSAALSSALTADILIVSLYASERVPFALSAWLEVLFAKRVQAPGVLVALIGRPQPAAAGPSAVAEYLYRVAAKANFDFLPEEILLPDEPSAFLPQVIRVPARAAAARSEPALGWDQGLAISAYS
jgi:hypothetical protein